MYCRSFRGTHANDPSGKATLPDLHQQCGVGMQKRIGVVMRIRYIVIVVAIAAITGSYWLAADPPSPWVLAIAAAGILVSIGITIAKSRAGHFDKN